MLTNQNLLLERPHPNGDGIQRIYRFPDGHGLSLINSTMAHAYRYAWEAAVLKDVSDDGQHFSLTYDTPLTSDVEVFAIEAAANQFIMKAARLFSEAKVEKEEKP